MLLLADFTAPVAAFNNSSMRDLVVHVANTYRHWLGIAAHGQPHSYYAPAQVPDVAAVQQLFQEIDELVVAYTTLAERDWQTPQTVAVPGRAAPLALTPLALFTHVITHEFHHKGQLLRMSRQLGYTPTDTDVIRF
ncbi:DinB family protein [Hymenobacter sp. BT186]|uniref:DinB family protein n=1 Tax=Hymenobacter telluris TaxID=2816474 RepID=A0A939EXA9_9BACT|nr:DinB family protein [Hymenobacter telluris]MBO0358846.1 DinB family protein [Hymenobacter telluris]MBW3374872.1 DinB family protein [Hymenobacter norwichensis]